MMQVCWPYFDPEFDSLVEKYHGPRVCIDNENLEDCTVVKVDSANKKGLLLDVVQALTEMDLIITKGYVSSDAGWFMDVFHVTDQLGHKAITERRYNPESGEITTCLGNVVGSESAPDLTVIEMTAGDRPGIFSEISAVLNELGCNVIAAHMWTHNARLACIVYVTDESTSSPIEDPSRLADIQDHLSTVLKASDGQQGGRSASTWFNNSRIACTDRRLHQLMLADRDFEQVRSRWSPRASDRAEADGFRQGNGMNIVIDSCKEKGYSVVNIRCKDRPKLMFDTVCTLTDMQYVAFHATITSHGPFAYQEYYIRHVDGSTLDTESEKQRVVKCLEAAIERRVCEGIRVELCTSGRSDLLSEATRLLRENGLSVVRADVSTHGQKSKNVFYVRDASGNAVDMKALESIRRGMRPWVVKVKDVHLRSGSPERQRFSIGGMLKSQFERFSHEFISIR
ncbi:ACT domain-containing protein [Nymphaea thermarum]|nr:ACT domain-containing protein [Nymphaea thermarum]